MQSVEILEQEDVEEAVEQMVDQSVDRAVESATEELRDSVDELERRFDDQEEAQQQMLRDQIDQGQKLIGLHHRLTLVEDSLESTLQTINLIRRLFDGFSQVIQDELPKPPVEPVAE